MCIRDSLHFFWDEEEKDCPPAMIDTWLAKYRAAGLSAVSSHVSKVGDALRWRHAYRISNRDLCKADDLYLPDVLAAKKSSPRLPKKGRLVVNGYLITRSFAVWIEDGQKGRIVIDYDLTSKGKPQVTVLENPRDWKVRIELTTPLAVLP